ncbi:MAG: hypothetical protein AAFO07_32975 [Bacteroidota bacterium]
MNNKELLKRWGENTAYSAKTHFKMSDFNRYWIYSLIVVNLTFAIFSVLEFGEKYVLAAKIFSLTSLLASILILIHESRSNRQVASTNKEIGELYLALHYDIERLFAKKRVSNEEVDEIKNKITALNTSMKPSVNFIAKFWATRAIENKGEMHKWWKDD